MTSTSPNNSNSPSKKRLTFFRWLTTPSFLYGIAIGIALSITAALILNLKNAWYVAAGLLAIVIILLLGALIGHRIFESQKEQLRKEFDNNLEQSKATLITIPHKFLDYLVEPDKTKSNQTLEEIREQLPRIQPVVLNTLRMIPSLITRILAMSSLIAVLGGSVSFAIFLATYMQVERLSEQNALQMMSLATDLNKELSTTAHQKIESAIVDCKCLYNGYGGEFSYQEINAYLSFFDTIGYYNKLGLLNKGIIDDLFGAYIIEAYVYEEIEKYIEQMQDPQQGGQEKAFIHFQYIAEELLKEYPHREKHAESYRKNRRGEESCLLNCSKLSQSSYILDKEIGVSNPMRHDKNAACTVAI